VSHDEERDRQQGEVLGLRHGQLDGDGEGQFRVLDEEQRPRDADRESDGHAHQ
jgi:hypothetical protein